MRKKLITACSLVLVALTVALLWPTAGYDVSRVHPTLRELSIPYQRVSAFVSSDGSIGMTIVDSSGRKVDLGLPASVDDGPKHPDLYFGRERSALTDDTRRMLVSILAAYNSSTNANNRALVSLRGAPRDYMRIAIQTLFH